MPRSPRRHGSREAGRNVIVTLVVVALLGLVGYVAPSTVPLPLRRLVGLERPLGHPPTAVAGGSYAFIAHQPGDPDDPVAYDPCRSIHVQLDPAGGPPDAVALTERAMERVSEATGLRFVYDGTTDRRPQWRTPYTPSVLGHEEPVLVSFANEHEVPELAGDVAGVGGSVQMRGVSVYEHYVTGGVTLDSDAFADLLSRPNGAAEAQAIVFHEFGHLVGLAHVDDPGELMFADNVGRTDFGPGDLTGLARLGAGRCF